MSKYVHLLLACGFIYGSNVGYDTPATIYNFMDSYMDDENEINETRFNILYVAYSIPNIILPLYSGSLISNFGLHGSIFSLCSCVLIGVVSFAIGLQFKIYLVMLIGRVFLGIGSECLAVVQSSYVTRYFSPSETALALSISMTSGRLVSVLNYTLLPFLASLYGPVWAGWYAPFASIISLSCAFIAWKMDTSNRNHVSGEGKCSKDGSTESIVEMGGFENTYSPENGTFEISSIKRRSVITFTKEHYETHDGLSSLDNVAPPKPTTIVKSLQKFYFHGWSMQMIPTYIEKLPFLFWILTIILICLNGSTLNFIPVAPLLLSAKYAKGKDSIKSTAMVSIPDSISVFLMPFVGYLTHYLSSNPFLISSQSSRGSSSEDKKESKLEKKVRMVRVKTIQCIISALFIFLSHFLFAFSMDIRPEWILVLLGIGYATYGSTVYSLMADLLSLPSSSSYDISELLFPSSSHTSPISKQKKRKYSGLVETEGFGVDEEAEEELVACAYGVSGCLSNASFSIIPLLISLILSEDNGTIVGEENNDQGGLVSLEKYVNMELLFIFLSSIGVILSFFLLKHINKYS